MLKQYKSARALYVLRDEKIDVVGNDISFITNKGWAAGKNLLFSDKKGGILYCLVFHKQKYRVYIVNEAMGDEPEYCAFSKDQVALRQFSLDLKITTSFLSYDLVKQKEQ